MYLAMGRDTFSVHKVRLWLALTMTIMLKIKQFVAVVF